MHANWSSQVKIKHRRSPNCKLLICNGFSPVAINLWSRYMRQLRTLFSSFQAKSDLKPIACLILSLIVDNGSLLFIYKTSKTLACGCMLHASHMHWSKAIWEPFLCRFLAILTTLNSWALHALYNNCIVAFQFKKNRLTYCHSWSSISPLELGAQLY